MIFTDDQAKAIEQNHNVYVSQSLGVYHRESYDATYGWAPIPQEWIDEVTDNRETGTAHTLEPWEVSELGKLSGSLTEYGNYYIVRAVDPEGTQDKDNRKRIVECVNACAGIADPSVVPELVEALKLCEDVLTEVGTAYDDGDVRWVHIGNLIHARNKAIESLRKAGIVEDYVAVCQEEEEAL
jgi:hypothetical protein